MQWILILCILSAVALCGANTSKKQPPVSAEVKLQQISELAAKSKGNVVTLDDSTYSYYAVSKPRPYSLIVFLTAAHPKFKCSICKDIDSELSLLASSYAKQHKADDKPVFFVRLDYESSQKVFQSYAVQSVPLLFHLGPSQGEKAGTEYQIGIRDRFQVSADVDAERISQFLSDRAGVSVKIQRSQIMSYVIMLVFFAIVLALVQPVIHSLPTILRIAQWKPIWLIVSLGIYTCAISGLIFDIIRSPPMYHANPSTGQIQFFYPQSGNQFVVEGFVIGFLNLGCAAGLAIVTMYAPYFKDENHRAMGIMAGVALFLVCFRMVRSLYIMKNPWYGRQF